jgi:hypothetical protein
VEEITDGKVSTRWFVPANNIPMAVASTSLIFETPANTLCAQCSKPGTCTAVKVSLWVKPDGEFEVRDPLNSEAVSQTQPVSCPKFVAGEKTFKNPSCLTAHDLKTGRPRTFVFEAPCS